MNEVAQRPGRGGRRTPSLGRRFRKSRAGCFSICALVVAVLALSAATGLAWADSVKDGNRALEAGRLDDALHLYEQAARQGSARGLAGVGRVWLRRGQYGKALEAFRRSAETDPDLALAYYGQGEVLRRQEQCAQAIPLFEKAVRLERKLAQARLGLGNCLIATGQFDRGMTELGKGLKLGGRWAPRFLVARGTAWMSRDSLRKAAIDFTRARVLAPDDPSIRKAIGDFYLQRGTWSLAIPELEAAVALDSTDAEAQYSLARALFYDGRYDQALETYQRLTARHPDFAPGLLGLGDLLYRAGVADPRRYADARGRLEEYVRLEPGDPKGWSLLGRTLYRLGDRDSALSAMLEAEQLGDKSKELYTTLGLAYADRKEWDRALEWLQKGDLGPREHTLLAQIYEVTGNPDQADSLYRLLLAQDSTSAAAAGIFNELGKLRFRARNFPDAERFFERAIALDPRDGEAYFYRGLALRELKRDPEALTALQKAASIDTAKADRFFWLGVAYDGQKQFREAEDAFRRATELDSSGPIASKAYGQLGFYRLLKKQWSAATRLLERAVALDPKDSQAWLWLGQGYQNAGNREKATESYRRVLTLDPGNQEAKKGLESLRRRASRDQEESPPATVFVKP